ncbi:MAG TPA: hypothetical protein VFV34_13015 [Blastocatellia bacterium]|nr:hypothetical protein [Blastocatellia bacterium]
MLYGIHAKVSTKNRGGRRFFRAESESADDRFRRQERAVRIAELVFNLQTVEGIKTRLSALAAGQIEDTYAELEAAGYLKRRGLNLRFVTPTGRKGGDYDAEVILSDSSKVNCEMKCKVEDSHLTSSGLLTSLKGARRQLPADEAAVVFIKIPESWLADTNLNVIIAKALEDFFRSTSRVVGVVLRWEEVWLELQGPSGAVVYKYRLERKHRTSASSLVGDLLDAVAGPGYFPWVSFRKLVEKFCNSSVSQGRQPE